MEISAVLGVLSGSTQAHSRRRAAIRGSWLLEPTPPGITVKFVLRCGSSTEVLLEARRHADVHCTPLSDSSRARGAILALHAWLAHAVVAYPKASFIGKADDDVCEICTHPMNLELALCSVACRMW